MEKKAGHCRLAGDELNQQGNLHTKLVLDGHKTHSSWHPTARIIKVYIETLTGFSHIQSRESQQHVTLSRLCPWNSSHCGNSGKNIYATNRGEGSEAPDYQVSGGHSTGNHELSMTFTNNFRNADMRTRKVSWCSQCSMACSRHNKVSSAYIFLLPL